jgi:uncharacterized protein YvpB
VFASFLIAAANVSNAAFAATDFTDFSVGAEVNFLIDQGIINGYEDGTFRPRNEITRAEFTAMLCRAMKEENSAKSLTGQSEFSDVKSSNWASGYIQWAKNNGIINGVGDGRFDPQGNATYEQTVKMIVLAMGYEERLAESKGGYPRGTSSDDVGENTSGAAITGPAISGVTPDAVSPDFRGARAEAAETALQTDGAMFTDIANSYAAEDIEKLYAAGILTDYPDGSFRLGDIITRAETAAALQRLFGPEDIPPPRALPDALVTEAPYISQLYPVNAPVGCEPTSLLMALKAKGYAADVDLRQFLDDMPKDKENPAKGFVGSPYRPDRSKKTRTTIDPGKLSEYGRLYGNVVDISGHSPHELQSYILAGNLVVIYATLWWEQPFYRTYIIEGQSKRILSNNHAVLVNGYDRNAQAYYISDPYNLSNTRKEYRYWIAAETFDRIYNERRFALLIE